MLKGERQNLSMSTLRGGGAKFECNILENHLHRHPFPKILPLVPQVYAIIANYKLPFKLNANELG